MQEEQLEALEGELAAVSDRMAAARRADDLAAAVRRQVARPVWALAALLGGTLALGVLSRWWGPGALAAAVAILILSLPGQVRAVRARRRQAEDDPCDLFVAAAQEVGQRFNSQVVQLLFSLPTALALLVLAAVVERPAVPLALAAALVAYLPFLFFFRLRWTALEKDEVERWRRELDPEAWPEEPDVDAEEEDDDDDDDDDESWQSIFGHLLLRSVQLALLYLGPPLMFVLVVMGVLGDDPQRPLVAAATLAVLWVVQWKFFLPEGGDDA